MDPQLDPCGCRSSPQPLCAAGAGRKNQRDALEALPVRTGEGKLNWPELGSPRTSRRIHNMRQRRRKPLNRISGYQNTYDKDFKTLKSGKDIGANPFATPAYLQNENTDAATAAGSTADAAKASITDNALRTGDNSASTLYAIKNNQRTAQQGANNALPRPALARLPQQSQLAERFTEQRPGSGWLVEQRVRHGDWRKKWGAEEPYRSRHCELRADEQFNRGGGHCG